MTSAILRSAQAGAILTALGLSVGLMTGVAQAAPPREHNCPSPFFGDGLNARYGVSERIVGPPGCLEAFAGEKWVRAVPPWVTAKAGEAVYPPGYVGDPDPIKDFEAKFVGARYVIDGGTAEEKTVNAGKEILQKGNIDETSPILPGFPFIVPVSPVFNPLSVCGDGSACHHSTLFVTMTAQHCSGRDPNAPGLNANCLPQGESEWPIAAPMPFTVSSQPPPTPQG